MELKAYKEPWKETLHGIRSRISKAHGLYYRKGIKCLITAEELKILWFRDKAYAMDKPSIDRKKNSGHYTFENCQYIEHRINSGKLDRTPELSKKYSENGKIQARKNWDNPICRKKLLKSLRVSLSTPAIKKIRSLELTGRWKTPEYRKRMKLSISKRKRDSSGRFK